jgi:DNA recombination protein RmuC
MDTFLLVVILVVIIVAVVMMFFLIQNKKNDSSSNDLMVQLNNNLSNDIKEIRKEVSSNSSESRKEIEGKLKDIGLKINDFQKSSKTDMQKQFSESNKVIKDVTSQLEKIKGTNEQVLNFANQMKTLEKILGNQKQRGILGEIQLENLLANVLPPELFKMQYSFSNGEMVDAIVKVGDFIIPVDAKFSLDNYNKMIESTDKNEIELLEKKFKADIKSRIDETAKYIRPGEKTTDYAYMFIPADGLYQDLLNSRVGTLQINSKDLVSYAYTKKVMVVSPMSLFPMLQITVKALHNLKVENSIEDIKKNIEKLGSHLNAYKDYHDKLGKTIGTVVNHYNSSSKEFKKIDKDVIRISGGTSKIGFEQELIDKPSLD